MAFETVQDGVKLGYIFHSSFSVMLSLDT